jgi:SAM-dependent methyltransferase
MMTDQQQLSDKEIWNEALPHELRHWEYWMSHESIRPHKEARMSPTFGFPWFAQELLKSQEGATIKVLDLGSGPASTVGSYWPGRTVLLTRVDPLADEYNELLQRHGYQPNIVKGDGEALLDAVAERDFDFVHSGNALDHAYNPLRCVQNMINICKPAGWIYFLVFENEGEYEKYAGLHQWNFCLENGDIFLWNKSSRVNLRQELSGYRALECVREQHPTMNRPALLVKIQK